MDNKIKQKITQTHINGLYNIIVVGGDKLLKGLILQLLVRTNNIRYTHFSRNPRIAGLHEPEYFCNAFILQTVIFDLVEWVLFDDITESAYEAERDKCRKGTKA